MFSKSFEYREIKINTNLKRHKMYNKIILEKLNNNSYCE
jgi:hypothetical protein